MGKVSIKKNMFLNILLTSTRFIFPLITFTYVSRILTPVGTGKVAFATSILSCFTYIATLGVPSYGVRSCAAVRDDKQKLSKTTFEILAIESISTIISYLLLIAAVLLIPKFRQESSLFWVMSISIALNTIGIEWLYQALEQYSYITIRSLIFKIITIALTFLLIKTTDDYILYGFITIAATSASNICNLIHARKYLSLKSIGKLELKKHISPILMLFTASIMISVYHSFDVTMIGFIKSDADVGYYNVALKIKNIVWSLSAAIIAVLVPRMANYYKNDKSKFDELTVKALRLCLLTVIPISIFACINAKNIVLVISGEEYVATIPTLMIFMGGMFIMILSNIFGNMLLVPMGKEKRYTQSVGISMVVNLILNSIMIPFWGAFGAAIATVFAELSNVILWD